MSMILRRARPNSPAEGSGEGRILARRRGASDEYPGSVARDPLARTERASSAPGIQVEAPKGSVFALGYLLLITVAVNQMFFLVPWQHIHGVFNVRDVGNGLILLGLPWLLLTRSDLSIFKNPFSILFLIYLPFAVMQAAFASFNFGQPILSSIIGVRDQLYYLSFFVFLLLLDTPAKIERMLNLLTIVAVVVFALGLINYFGPTLFYQKWAHGHGIRAGIVRGYMPAMNVVSLAALWMSSRWMVALDRTARHRAGFWTIVLIGAHFFQQTRSRIIAITAVLLAALFFRKRYALLVGAMAGFLAAAGVAQLFMKDNLVIDSFASAAQNLQEGSGTWGARETQIETDIKVFLAHPWLGSGATALRVASNTDDSNSVAVLNAIVTNADLGYTHWLKAYGVAGILWLVAFFVLLWRKARALVRMLPAEYQPLALFCAAYVGYVTISFVTINHLMRPAGIWPLCLVVAAMVRLERVAQWQSGSPAWPQH